ncbi:MAG TPA: rRNA maturation RNase YbeY [Phycisphaerales bacterium]|nr:rRNA maturation RNase YbeY [Phycisphaerales bacterium]
MPTRQTSSASSSVTIPMRIEVVGAECFVPSPMARQLESWAGAAVRFLGAAGEVRAKLVGDERMAAAHLEHCGEPGTTDVITFDLAAGAAVTGGALDADLLVCIDEARRQSAARGIPLEHELLLYIVHGVLHCLGHDDHDDDAAIAMHAREDEVFRALGLEPAYSAPGRG